MTKKWLDSIEKRRRRIDLKKRYKHTDRQTYIQTESTTKNSRLLAGAESTDRHTDGSDFIICPMLCYSNGTDNKVKTQ